MRPQRMMATHDRLITVASPSGQFPGEAPLPGTDLPVPALRIVSSTSEEIMVPPRGAPAALEGPQERGSLGAGPSALPPPALHNPPSTARSLYVGKLHPAVTEAMLHSIFATLGPVEEVKIIRDKLSGVSAGYGFVTYQDHRRGPAAHPTHHTTLTRLHATASWRPRSPLLLSGRPLNLPCLSGRTGGLPPRQTGCQQHITDYN